MVDQAALPHSNPAGTSAMHRYDARMISTGAESGADASRAARPIATGLRPRLLAEAVAALDADESTDTARADAIGAAAPGDLEGKIIARAAAHPRAGELNEALDHASAGMTLAALVAAVLALVGGAGAARGLLGAPRDEPVNFYLVLLGALGLQTLLLLAWLLAMLLGRRLGRGLGQANLGVLVVRVWHRLSRALHRGQTHAAALAAWARVLTTPAVARATFGSISHALWLAFNVGLLIMTIVQLSARQYSFAWETTILSREAYVPLTGAIAALPRAAGFGAPRNDQIAASQWTGDDRLFTQDQTTSQAWSALLVGCIVMYGFAPRTLLLAWCLGARRMAHRRFRLDVARPEFLRHERSLLASTRRLGVIDPDDDSAMGVISTRAVPPFSAPPRPVGPPAIIGIEVRTNSPWPPSLNGIRWRDLGIAESSQQQRQAIELLQRSDTEPSSVAAVCSLTTTPDRGIGRFLAELTQAARRVVVVLTGGHTLRQRADVQAIEHRVADWRSLARDAGVDSSCVLELDLDHLTESSLERLRLLVGGAIAGDAPAATRKLEAAFDLIVQAAEDLAADAETSTRAAAALHREILRLYRETGHDGSWRAWLARSGATGAIASNDLANHMRQRARDVLDVLPARLKASPKWLAAGAGAGAMGCIAAASLLSPVAIGALPMWSLLGAAISGAIQQFMPGTSDQAIASGPPARGGSVRSAALFAMLLELQGRDEAAITRILDAAIEPDDPAGHDLDGSPAIPAWLDELRHRFDLALAREASPAGLSP